MKTPRAFTLIETAAAIAAAGLAIALTAVAIGTTQPRTPEPKPDPAGRGENDPEVIKARKATKLLELQLKDGTQIRGIHQGLVMFAQNNKDLFPLPSKLDVKDETVKLQGAEKDTTANIMSILIFNGFFGPEIAVSTAESNDKIKVCETYEYANPKVVTPGRGLWDPAFSADFSDGNTGNFSYAHQMPSKSRAETWKAKFDADRPTIGNRGPKVVSTKPIPPAEGTKAESVDIELAGKSKTFLIHGNPATWEGNIAYGDNHVNLETKMYQSKSTYKDDKGNPHPDVFFYNEPDDATDTNTMMGIYTHAGISTRNFKAIWD